MLKITPVYIAEVHATGGRNGHVKSTDGIIDLDTAIPTGMGGTGGHKTNPEQLFAAGYAACFGGAIGWVGKGKDISGFTIQAQVGFGKSEEGIYGINAKLEVHFPNLSIEEGQQIVDAAHQVCPYSQATRGNIEVIVTAV
ncbi:MAG: organic hydroperoxide resistance protein [Microscillaceae bacterium]|nr:organic hydroperoxide resistance protein [Microscillaceae bacterium]